MKPILTKFHIWAGVCVFRFSQIRTLVAMAAYSCHWLMGNLEISNFCCLTAFKFFFFLQKCFLSSPLRFIWILSKSLILIGCHGNRKATLSKKYSKIFFSEAIRGMKLKLCTNVHDISLYINYSLYCCCPCALVAMATCYSNLKFPYTYNGKSGNRHLFLC